MDRIGRPIDTESSVKLRELTPDESRELLDEQAQRYLGMSGEEFERAWAEGAFGDDVDRPEVMRVAMLLPSA